MTRDPREPVSRSERRALDQLGRNFDAALEGQQAGAGRRRWLVTAASVAVAAAVALIVWSVAWPGDSRFAVESAQGSLSEIAAAQADPKPSQFTETEFRWTGISRYRRGVAAPAGVKPGELFTLYGLAHSWQSAERRGLMQTSLYAKGPDGIRHRTTRNRTRPAPRYQLAGRSYLPEQIHAMADDPSGFTRQIDRYVDQMTEAPYRTLVRWKYSLSLLQANGPPLSSSLRASLIAGLESAPGVSDPVKKRDPRGREGVELVMRDDGFGTTLRAIFDAKNARLIYSSETVYRAGGGPFRNTKPGDVVTSYLLLSSRVVDSVPQ